MVWFRAMVKRCCRFLALLGVTALVVAPTASAAKTFVRVEGQSYTQSTDITGQVTGQLNFSMVAQGYSGGAVTGSFLDQGYSVSGGTLTQTDYYAASIDCLSADKSTGTVWFSGPITLANDQRLPTDQQNQFQSIISSGNLILIGRLRDTNGDGTADERSLFLTDASKAYPNALLSASDNGTVTTPWFINGDATSAASACLLRDNAYLQADYQVVDGPTNQVQWLTPDDNPFNPPNVVTGTAHALANPPAASLYTLAPANRTLVSPTVYLTIG